jgi:hypothetical protein
MIGLLLLEIQSVTPGVDNNNFLRFSLPAVARKKVTAAFDGGRLSSDWVVMLLRDVERRRGLARWLAGSQLDRPDLSRIDHEIVELLRQRVSSSLRSMSAPGVRRDKAALSSGWKPHPAIAPAGSNRSSHGGNEMAEAFG